MLDVEMMLRDDIEISNVHHRDLIEIKKWMEMKNAFAREETDLDKLTERFLESYISECEFFLKIKKNNKLAGILKGRIEFKVENELWIWFFYLDKIYDDLRDFIIIELMNYFSKEYNATVFFTRVIKNEIENLNFWKQMGFKTIRMVKNFYNVNDRYMDMIIMGKVNG
ncbi:GNAT family N-acetyltransferase [Clostridium sp. MT-14]|uniref:GNAT family N-acetyltransferase n=1 Tax=Clostridium sp. MT-14 TaxID=3348360 RepID=UPI0035F414DB